MNDKIMVGALGSMKQDVLALKGLLQLQNVYITNELCFLFVDD